MRIFLCNLIAIKERNGETIDFAILNETMPELGANNLLVSWNHGSTMPRVIKTHKRYVPLFGKTRSLGIIRDPRDVMVSYYHYCRDRKRVFSGTFGEFIRTADRGIPAWFKHYNSWRDRWTMVVKYETMKREPRAMFEDILGFLNVSVTSSQLEAAILRSDTNRVIAMDKKVQQRGESAQFVRSSKINQWTSYFDDEDRILFERAAEAYEFDLYE